MIIVVKRADERGHDRNSSHDQTAAIAREEKTRRDPAEAADLTERLPESQRLADDHSDEEITRRSFSLP